MVHERLINSRLQLWVARLARLPRWVWIAFGLGVIVPILVLGASLLVFALLFGTLAAMVAMLVATVLRGFRRLSSPRSTAIDNAARRNVRIAVSSVRVIDP